MSHDPHNAWRPLSCAASMLSRLSYLDTGDPQIAEVIAKVRKVIGKDIPILITGETGTGKELLAQAIHNDSPRRSGAFVAVNCASIPETLIESELFGYEEGAFTGARRKGAVGKLLAGQRRHAISRRNRRHALSAASALAARAAGAPRQSAGFLEVDSGRYRHHLRNSPRPARHDRAEPVS